MTFDNSDPHRSFKFTQEEHERYLLQFYQEVPFESVRGKLSPYTSTPINDWHDYTLYGHCYSLKHITENELRSIENSCHEAVAAAKSDFQKIELHNKQLCFANKSLMKRNGVLLFFVIILSAVLFISFLMPNPLSDDVENLRSDISSLQNSLSLSEDQVSLLSDLSDSAYQEGYADASRDFSVSHSASSVPDKVFVYIGNRRTGVLHRPDCQFLPAADRRVLFDSIQQAILDSYTLCSHCFS